jgi:hypothetical protein
VVQAIHLTINGIAAGLRNSGQFLAPGGALSRGGEVLRRDYRTR